mgnify:CR=1 FL=1
MCYSVFFDIPPKTLDLCSREQKRGCVVMFLTQQHRDIGNCFVRIFLSYFDMKTSVMWWIQNCFSKRE